MPADMVKLYDCLAHMKSAYLADPTASVRSQSFINKLHDYCLEELEHAGITSDSFDVQKEATIYGSHKPKDVDIAVIENINGPQIIIGIRSQMSSVSKNRVFHSVRNTNLLNREHWSTAAGTPL